MWPLHLQRRLRCILPTPCIDPGPFLAPGDQSILPPAPKTTLLDLDLSCGHSLVGTLPPDAPGCPSPLLLPAREACKHRNPCPSSLHRGTYIVLMLLNKVIFAGLASWQVSVS